ncbi:hypothetical protein C0J52_24211 [Blattella germanica]|nr:hypothetical protein C0J52_24211 [Blattella germanica]
MPSYWPLRTVAYSITGMYCKQVNDLLLFCSNAATLQYTCAIRSCAWTLHLTCCGSD